MPLFEENAINFTLLSFDKCIVSFIFISNWQSLEYPMWMLTSPVADLIFCRIWRRDTSNVLTVNLFFTRWNDFFRQLLLKCLKQKNDQKCNSWNLTIFGYRQCKQSWIYTLIFINCIISSRGWVVGTLASHARGLGFKPRAGHAFLFLSNAKKSDKHAQKGFWEIAPSQ